MKILTSIVGFLAAFVGTSLMVPQVYKSIITKSVKDLSTGTLFLYFLNCLLWLTYGLLIGAWPVIICNTISLVISIVQLAIKLKYNG